MSKLNPLGKTLKWLSLFWCGLALIRISLGLIGWLEKEDIRLGVIALIISATSYRVGRKLEGTH
jgi:hypothetical protein